MIPLSIQGVDVTLGKKKVLHNLHFVGEKGKVIGLIGPNGSGKSTLLKTIAKMLPTSTGRIEIQQKNQSSYSRKELAKEISYVPQDTTISFDFTVRDIVTMGRHVYSSLFRGNQPTDEQMVAWAMDRTYTTHLENRSVLHLSGGQRQLVIIAKALAQNTPILLLDEPIAALDIYYQLHILDLLRQLSKEGRTVIIVLHDLNLASRFCDQLVLLHEGRVKQIGSSEVVLTETWMKKVYDVNARIEHDVHTRAVTITPYV